MSFDSVNKGKEMKDYFNISVSVSCDLKSFKCQLSAKTEGRLLLVKHYFTDFTDACGKFFES